MGARCGGRAGRTLLCGDGGDEESGQRSGGAAERRSGGAAERQNGRAAELLAGRVCACCCCFWRAEGVRLLLVLLAGREGLATSCERMASLAAHPALLTREQERAERCRFA